MPNFWKNIQTPVFMLAPMEDVTDTVFREIVLSVSQPEVLQVVFTEFVSTDGLASKQGYDAVARRLEVNATENEILRERGAKLVVQIWGNDPEKNFKAARHLEQLGRFDGIDINMGCPVKKVVKKGCCSALIATPGLAKEIIQACHEGTSLPVSVKTRIGLKEIATEAWIGHLLETPITALTIHGRTQKLQSNGEADWDEIALAVKLRDLSGRQIPVFGNGDVRSYGDGIQRIRQYGVDGIMVGRGIFHNPWLFRNDEVSPSIDARLNLLLKHIELYDATWGEHKPFEPLKRFLKIYISGFRGAAEMRNQLMNMSQPADAVRFVGSERNVRLDTLSA